MEIFEKTNFDLHEFEMLKCTGAFEVSLFDSVLEVNSEDSLKQKNGGFS